MAAKFCYISMQLQWTVVHRATSFTTV